MIFGQREEKSTGIVESIHDSLLKKSVDRNVYNWAVTQSVNVSDFATLVPQMAIRSSFFS